MSLSSSEARDQFPDLVEDLETLQKLENERDIRAIEHALEHGEFEDWEVAKKELLAAHGLTEKDVDGIKENDLLTDDRE